jgi:type III secretory pathway lipoprotein EscJ
MSLPKCLLINMANYFPKNILLLFFLTLLLSACGNKVIVSTPDENELNQMLVALQESDIDAERQSSGELGKEVYTITVNDGFYSIGAEKEARRILDDNCLPYQPPPEVKEGGMGLPSGSVEQEKRKVQAQINIEKLLLRHNGAICAKVNIVYPEKAMESFNPYSSSATVLLKNKGPLNVTEEKIKEEVARSVEKLKPENVTVTIEPKIIEKAKLKTANSMNKMFVTGGVVAGLIGLTMVVILFMRRSKRPDDEFDDTEFLEEGEVNLLESAEKE